ncbi:L,D-transpeptidase family protein [Pontibacter sp. Tf4]|uniref:L,D-transpeptidase family protein n=1 Tax=Pontibacter sp. Tf4 TaxID=2761620 RepID=UPI00162ABC68|nr:L,D-transpeptidase family protein [Pontibacter sp. Tf4]MBB6612575.1 L,D-transpeptidase family protein [Pontibacter sp. Tf4]
MVYRWLILLLLLLPGRLLAQLPEPAWLQTERQAQLMQQAIDLYSCISTTNTWYTLPANLRLSPGDTNQYVPNLQHNLLLTRDLQPDYSMPTTIYDTLLVSAAMRFQQRHGLKADGRIGPRTIAELNVPPARRLQLLRNNLQRWKNTTSCAPRPAIYINIPAFELYVLDTSRVLLQMKVITGKPATPTYQITTELQSIVVNPTWNLPRSIAVNEIVPILRRNPNYLNKRNMRVYLNGRQINPWRVNWKAVNSSNYSYQITQMPGRDNELGELKFLYDSKVNQYMHDTPRKELFDYYPRDFSHGCIRLEKPYELALYLLQYHNGFSKAKAEELLHTRKPNHYLHVRKNMALFILYQTAWVDQHGLVQFRKDVYGYEKVNL